MQLGRAAVGDIDEDGAFDRRPVGDLDAVDL